MTYKEAKEYILQNYFDGDEDVTASSGDEEIEAMKCAVGALEKQIPKKPFNNGLNLECPYCFTFLEQKPEWCDICGQHLDWGKDNGNTI